MIGHCADSTNQVRVTRSDATSTPAFVTNSNHFVIVLHRVLLASFSVHCGVTASFLPFSFSFSRKYYDKLNGWVVLFLAFEVK